MIPEDQQPRHSHVYAAASGFGLRVIPLAAPYDFALGPESPQLDVGRWQGQTRIFARLTPDAGGYTSLIAHSSSLAEILDVVHGPVLDRWWLETALYRVPLLHGWKALAQGASSPCVFDLVGPGGALMFVQTPHNRVTKPERLRAPGQHIHEQGSDAKSSWIDVRYSHQGSDWVQRHDIVDVANVQCVVTVQCPLSSLAAIAPTHLQVVAAIAPRAA